MGVRRERLEPIFGEVTLAGQVANAHGVDNEEQGAPVWLCRQQQLGWAKAWTSLERYN